jgi:hypothetical protein
MVAPSCVVSSICKIFYAQLPIQWVPGVLALGVKRPGHEADHSPPSSAEVKNVWSYTSAPTISLRGVVLSYKKGTETTLHIPSDISHPQKADDGFLDSRFIFMRTHVHICATAV